ncbi:transposase [Microvirga terrae]|uniref:transposase n=1 Tax=Microvirga terrae TaxID=2740529 RepID=UPI003D812BD8
MSDGAGLSLAFTFTPGQRHEVPVFEQPLRAVRLPNPRGRPTTLPKHLAGDRAYSYRPVYRYLRRRHIRPVIPPGAGGNIGGCARAFNPDLYSRRNVIERCVG